VSRDNFFGDPLLVVHHHDPFAHEPLFVMILNAPADKLFHSQIRQTSRYLHRTLAQYVPGSLPADGCTVRFHQEKC